MLMVEILTGNGSPGYKVIYKFHSLPLGKYLASS